MFRTLTNLGSLFQRFQSKRSWLLTYSSRCKTYKSQEAKVEEIVISTGKLEKDVLLYSQYNRKHFGILIAFFAGTAVFFLTTAESFYAIGKTLKEQKSLGDISMDQKDQTRWGVSLWTFKQGSLHTYFASGLAFIGVMCFLCAIYIPARYLKAVVLRKDNNSICLCTYAPFGPTKYLVLPVEKVHASTPWIEGRPVLVKAHKYLVPFYISAKGQIHNKEQIRRSLRHLR